MRAAITDALSRTTSGDGPTLARASLRATLETCRSDPRIPRVMFIEVLSKGAGRAALTEIRTYEDLIGQLATGLYPDLDKRRIDVRLLSSGLYGSTISIITRWARGGFRVPLERVLNHCVLFYESVIHELERRRLGVADGGIGKPARSKQKTRGNVESRTANPVRLSRAATGR